MKKSQIFILGILFLLTWTNVIYAAPSESFLKVLSAIQIPVVNSNGYTINEEVYEKYHLISYGTPQDVLLGQRWKDTTTGKWTNSVTGQKGEYRILGYNVFGGVVNNELFPDDSVSGTSPESWNYVVVKDAASSWNQTEKYQTEKQINYMMTQPWQRKGITYQLTAQNVGLEKARVENFATWKTAGSIFTMKRNPDGQIWEATFSIPPMAADAILTSHLVLPNGTRYCLEEGQDTIEIPYHFGADVSHLGEYATANEIAKLSSSLEMNFQAIDKIVQEKTTHVAKENKLIIHRNNYPGAKKISISLCNTALLETCFHSEVPMVDVKEIEIEVVFEEEQEEWIDVKENYHTNKESKVAPPRIVDIQLYRRSVQGNGYQTRLWQAKKTNVPFISAGQILVVEAKVINAPELVRFAIEGDASIQTMDALTKRFLYDEPKERRETMRYSSLNNLKKSFQLPRYMYEENGLYRIEYVIPYGTKQTIHSWSTLREQNQNALAINTSQLFTRITRPYQIKITAGNEGGATTSSVSLDVFERWDTIYNRDLKEYVK